jgi:ABC-type Fe3+-citrate transport system substrate-binding protein
MRELRKQVNKAIVDINNIWVEMIKEAQDKNEGIDSTIITGKVIARKGELDDRFDEAEERIAKKNGKIKWW